MYKTAFWRAAILGLWVLCPWPQAFPLEGPRGLSESELARLRTGSPVIRIIAEPSALSLPSSAPGADIVFREITALKPNYLIELVSQKKSVSGSDQLSTLAKALLDVPSYVNIPYYSERYKTTYALFDKAELVRTTTTPQGDIQQEAAMHMKPFEDYRLSFSMRQSGSGMVFSVTNLDPCVYLGISAVKPGVGLIVETSEPVEGQSITIGTTQGGWDAEIYAADSGPPTDLAGWGEPIGATTGADDQEQIALTPTGPARYYLIWFTKLATADDGQRVEVSDVALNGS